MVSVLISNLITDLRLPELMPGMEEECQKLLELFTDILPLIPLAELRAEGDDDDDDEDEGEGEEARAKGDFEGEEEEGPRVRATREKEVAKTEVITCLEAAAAAPRVHATREEEVAKTEDITWLDNLDYLIDEQEKISAALRVRATHEEEVAKTEDITSLDSLDCLIDEEETAAAATPRVRATREEEEAKTKAITEPKTAAKTWLRNLNAAAYSAADIVDEFRYAMLRAKVENDLHESGDEVRTNIFSLCKVINGMSLPFKGGMRNFKGGMRERLTEIIIEIGDLIERSSPYMGLQGHWLMPFAEGQPDQILSSLQMPDVKVVDTREIFMEITQLVHHIPHNGVDSTAVLPIIGERGIGKSYIASWLYNRISRDRFEVRLWVNVGVEFDIAKIVKSMIDQVIEKDCCLSEDDSDLLRSRIYQELSGKRYFLVLDDVQNLNGEKWEQLKSWLPQSVATVSFIIVTTRDKRVAEILSSAGSYQLKPCQLPSMDENVLLRLFSKIVFFRGHQQPFFVYRYLHLIVRGCLGLPLLVNLLGGLMRFKTEEAEWEEVNDQLINYNTEYKDPMWQITKMCINHLSSERKQCFAFFSLFPKGHYIDKEVLVKLWMANGLISSLGPTSVEQRGNHIFNEFALRLFFEEVKLVPESSSRDNHGSRSRVICKMHSFVHEMAIHISRNEYVVLPKSPDIVQSDEYPGQIRCLSIPGDSPVNIPVLLKDFPNVRALIFPHDPFSRNVNCSVIPKSNSLRALHLHSALFDRNLFELKYAKHLRYLDLSGSRIKILPESTSSLYFLQTLNLCKCLLLRQLPKGMRYMRNLRHLYVDKCPKLKKMPVHLGQLKCLQTLTTYIVGESIGNGIDEIKCLDLGSLLEIYNLRKVNDAAIAKEAKLIEKEKLERLTLCWGRQQTVMLKENNDLGVLEALQPHTKLQVLKIQQYGDREFANWLAYPVGLPNLVELHLICCSQCSTIPAVWKLPSLRVLCLEHMINLTCMCNFPDLPSIEGNDSSELFPSLKRLVLIGLIKLETWHEGEAMQRSIPSFPVLDVMEITNCPELKTMPSVPKLKYLNIRIENHGLLRSVIDLIKLSKTLVEVNMAKASGSDNEALPELRAEVDGRDSHNLRVMRLDSTNSFFMDRAILHLQLGFWRTLVSLEYLDIFNCSTIIDWPLEEFRNLGKLKRLSIRMCPNLTGELPRQLQEGEEFLPLLQSLEFYRCPSLTEVPRCSSILYLELDECPEINSILGLNNLEMLFLSCSSWTSLPTGLVDLKKLESLRVSECNSLTCLPDELANVTAIRTLIINKCPSVTDLPKGVNQMLSGLGKFQVSDCPDLEKLCGEEPYSSIISQIRLKSSAGPSTGGSSSDGLALEGF